MGESYQSRFRQIERRIKLIVREVDTDKLSKQEKHSIAQIKMALSEIRLDLRDYEFAETRAEQLKWRDMAHHNLRALTMLITRLGQIFTAIDVAELSAQIELVSDALS